MERKRLIATMFAAAIVLGLAAWGAWIVTGKGIAETSGPEGDARRLLQVRQLYAGYRSEFPQVEEVSPQEAREFMKKGLALFIDVRPKKERRVSTLPGAISKEEFLKNLRAHSHRMLITYCTISYRSGIWAQEMLGKGVRIINLEGGLLGWLHAGGEVFQAGRPIKKVHVYGSRWDLAPAEYQSVY